MLYLWRISQEAVTGYDTYDSAVVVAATEDQARRIYPGNTAPSGHCRWSDEHGRWERLNHDGTWQQPYIASAWPESVDPVKAEKLGPLGNTDFAAGAVVCASFNAG